METTYINSSSLNFNINHVNKSFSRNQWFSIIQPTISKSIQLSSLSEKYSDFQDYYFIHSDGENCWLTGLNEKLVLSTNSSIYSQYTISRKGKGQTKVNCHRVFAEGFISNPGCLPNVNHIDGNTYNFKLSNLNWCSQKMNMRHKVFMLKYEGVTFKQKVLNLLSKYNLKEISEISGVDIISIYKNII